MRYPFFASWNDKKNSCYYSIIAVSLLLNICYVYEWHQSCHGALLFPEHASQLGYNFYRYGTVTRLYEVAKYQEYKVVGTGTFLDSAPSMKDSVGYGVLLGLLWKITGSSSFYSVIFLQVLLFTLSLCFIFQALFWWYQDQQQAIFATLGVLLFLPGIFLNVQPVKDIWSFFGTVAILWASIGLMKKKIPTSLLIISAIFFVVCQWMRPTVFGVLLALSFVGLPLFYFFFKTHCDALKKLLLYFWVANIFFFWVPWMSYNKITYNRFFVGPTGLALLVSFADSTNKWGVQASESWVENHVKERYPNLPYQDGMQEYDDVIKSIFLEYVQEEPLLYFKNLAYRIVRLFFVEMPCNTQPPYFLGYKVYDTKIKIAFEQGLKKGAFGIFTWIIFFMYKVFTYLYIRFFLFLAYCGIVLSIYRKEFFLPLLITILVVGNLGEVVSHIEIKYLMQCYGFFGIFVGISLVSFQQKAITWWQRKKHVLKVIS